jgi:putative transposase
MSPCRRHISLNHWLQQGNIHASDVISFIKELHCHLQKPLTLVIDRYSVHRSAIRQLGEAGIRWFSVEWLPPYSPELDPVEAVWAHTKCVDLANFIPDSIDELYYAVAGSLAEQSRSASLKASYFQWAGLKL